MSAEPLKVRLARALGWTDIVSIGPRRAVPSWLKPGDEVWVGKPPIPDSGVVVQGGGDVGLTHEYSHIPPFGDETPEGWAAIGPELQRVGVLRDPQFYAEILLAMHEQRGRQLYGEPQR